MSRNTVIFIIFLIVISIPFALINYNHFPYSDGAEHGAAVRALAKNLIHPGDPMLNAVSGSSPRYVPSIFIMALFMKVSGLDVLVVLKIFEIAGLAFFLISVALFSREYFDDAGQSVWSIVVLLFLWGLGWTGANAYMFSAILYTAYYPSAVSFSLAFLALYFQLRFLRNERIGFLIETLMVGALCFVNHPLTGSFFFICSGLIYLEREGLSKRAISCYMLSIITTLCLTVLWPYYNFFASLLTVASGKLHKTMDYSLTRQYLYSMPLLRSGPVLAAIPVVVLNLMQRRYLLLWGGFLIFSFWYISGYYLTFSLAERSIFFIMVFLQLTISRTYYEWVPCLFQCSARKSKRIGSIVILVLLVMGILIQSKLIVKEFISPAFVFTSGSVFPHYVNPNAQQYELKKYLQEGDVVLSDIYSSWSIPVFTGARIIALYHTAPHIRDNAIRIHDVEAFYKPDTSNELRKKILKRYRVTHIFLNYTIDGRNLVPALTGMGLPVVTRTAAYCIFSVP